MIGFKNVASPLPALRRHRRCGVDLRDHSGLARAIARTFSAELNILNSRS